MTRKLTRALLACGVAILPAVGVCYADRVTVVDQKRQRFSISVLSIVTGDSIHYVNGDDVRHNIHVFGDDGTDVDKGLQDPGQTIEAKFDRFGRFVVRCSIHQSMKMKVEVR